MFEVEIYYHAFMLESLLNVSLKLDLRLWSLVVLLFSQFYFPIFENCCVSRFKFICWFYIYCLISLYSLSFDLDLLFEKSFWKLLSKHFWVLNGS